MFLFKRHPLRSAKNNFKAPVFFFFCHVTYFIKVRPKNKHEDARRPGHGPTDRQATHLLKGRGGGRSKINFLPFFFLFFLFLKSKSSRQMKNIIVSLDLSRRIAFSCGNCLLSFHPPFNWSVGRLLQITIISRNDLLHEKQPRVSFCA